MARGEPERCRAWSWSRFPREQQQPCVYACTQGAWAGQSWFPLAFPSPYFSALSLITSFLLSPTQIHHSFSKYLVSTYCVPGTLPALRTKRNDATSLHSSAAHLQLRGHPTHLGIPPNNRIRLRGPGVGPSTCISPAFPDDARATCTWPHSPGGF